MLTVSTTPLHDGSWDSSIDAARHFRLAGDDHDAFLPLSGALQMRDHTPSIAIGELPVENDDLVSRFIEEPDRVGRILCDIGANSIADELPNDGAARDDIVIDDQHTSQTLGHWVPFPCAQEPPHVSLCMQMILLGR